MTLLRSLAALLLAVVAAAPALAADPFITVTPPPEGRANSAWWILEMQSRPTGTAVAGLTLAQINAALGRNAPRWCAADALTAATFTSPDPAVHAEIQRQLGQPDGGLFLVQTRMTGVPLLAVAGNVRTCAGETAPFVLLVDRSRQASRLVFVHMFSGWTPFIWMRAIGNRLVFSSCFGCDHAEILSWNRRTRRFAWRSEGP